MIETDNINALRRLANSMSRAFRDSRGGSLMERFEHVSKILFAVIYQASHPDLPDPKPAKGESARATYERARALWRGIQYQVPDMLGPENDFPPDVEAVAKCMWLLSEVDVCRFPADARGIVYEELLRNTFEKDENQQYFTPSNIVGFMLALLREFKPRSVMDPACGSGGFLAAAAVKWHGADMPRIMGADIDARMSWVARTNLILHGAAEFTVRHLEAPGSLGEPGMLRDMAPEGVDLILENPPFGSDVSDKGVLERFVTGRGKPSRRRSVLFVERSIDLLSDGGVLAVVLDDSVLNLDANADIRALARRECALLAVISLPGVTFMPYSTANSSIVIMRKGAGQGPVFMARASEVGRRANGEPLLDDEGNLVSDLPAIEENWRRFRAGEELGQTDLGYTCALEDDLGTRFDASYYHPSRYAAAGVLGRCEHPIMPLADVFDFNSGTCSLKGVDEVVDWIGLADIEKRTGSFRVRAVAARGIRSQVHSFSKGDILFSRLRPELRKVAFCEDDRDGYCSSELVVMRVKEEYRDLLMPEYASIVLRSDVAYGQIVFKVTGLGRPRIGVPSLRGVLIPVPPIADQMRAIARYRSAVEGYRRTCRQLELQRSEALDALARSQELDL